MPAIKGVSFLTSHHGPRYTPSQHQKLEEIHDRIVAARRELDALIGDAYLRPRASIVPVHFLDLASAVEKLRWAEKEWRELNQQVAESSAAPDDEEPHPVVHHDELVEAGQRRSAGT